MESGSSASLVWANNLVQSIIQQDSESCLKLLDLDSQINYALEPQDLTNLDSIPGLDQLSWSKELKEFGIQYMLIIKQVQKPEKNMMELFETYK